MGKGREGALPCSWTHVSFCFIILERMNLLRQFL